MGHEQVSILDGGFTAWKGMGGDVESGEAPAAAGSKVGMAT